MQHAASQEHTCLISSRLPGHPRTNAPMRHRQRHRVPSSDGWDYSRRCSVVQSVQAAPWNSLRPGICTPVQLSISMTLHAAAIVSSVEMIEAQNTRRSSARIMGGAAGPRHELACIPSMGVPFSERTLADRRFTAGSTDRRRVVQPALVPQIVDPAGDAQRRHGAVPHLAVVADGLDDVHRPLCIHAEAVA